MSGLKSMTVKVFFPSDMEVGSDRARWYVEGAIRGWWQGFATENDPIRKMRGACVVFPAPPAAVAEQTDGEATKCENCGEPADDQSADTREHLAETGEVFCDTCVEESRDAAEAYAIEDGEED